MDIDIFIDSLTDCLLNIVSGEMEDTEFRLVTKPITQSYAKVLNKKGWRFECTSKNRI